MTEPPSDGVIRVLPQDVANQIAAGEVVERPASVVKELVENAIDAGATDIQVELEDAGVGLIAVIDDGVGMNPSDALIAFERHATSKVKQAEDLFRISTMGFRGEALASIAAVSTTTLITRRPADLSGTRVLVRAGEILEHGECGAPAGTRIEIVDLFGNTPARRKFLKSAATEVGHVSELITRTSLSFPNIGFHLKHGRRKLVDHPAASPEDRLAQVVGRERAGAMMKFQHRSAAGSVRGWLSGSHVSYPSNRQIFTYVNGRFVRDKLVSHAVVAGYSTLLMHGRYPGAVVFIEVPPDEVDVNVHPAKSEVRFRLGGGVHDLITQGVKSCLRAQGPQIEAQRSTSPFQRRRPETSEQMAFGGSTQRKPMGNLRLVPVDSAQPADAAASSPGGQPAAGPMGAPPDATSPASEPASHDTGRAHTPTNAPMPSRTPNDPLADGFFSGLHVIGQAFEGYLLCQSGDKLLIIDQHAAHERVMFERLRIAYSKGGVARQQLLVPVTVDVGPQAEAQLAEQASDLESLGFEIEPYGGGTVAVRAVPALLGDEDPAQLLRDLAVEIAEVGRSRALNQAAESVLSTLACHSAVRVGQNLNSQQIQALLDSMDNIDFAHNCPHGRPAYITLPRGDLERLFKRT